MSLSGLGESLIRLLDLVVRVGRERFGVRFSLDEGVGTRSGSDFTAIGSSERIGSCLTTSGIVSELEVAELRWVMDGLDSSASGSEG